MDVEVVPSHFNQDGAGLLAKYSLKTMKMKK